MDQMQPGQTPEYEPTYRVLRVEDTSSFIGATPQRVKRVTIQFANGDETSFDVPLSSYRADTVRHMAQEAAQTHYEVINIAGTVPYVRS